MKKGYNLLVFDALKYFIENPYSEIHLREFGRFLKISPNSASRFLDLFLNQGFVVEKRVANLRYFRANVDSVVFREIKKAYSVKLIEGIGLLGGLKDEVLSVMLFGSVAKGLDDFSSDIDLAIVGENKKKIREIVQKYQKKIKRELSCHVFTSIEWKKEKVNNRAFYQDVVGCGMNLIGEILI